MFDIVRNNKKVVQIVMAILLLPFAFFGVDSYIRDGGAGAGDVASVGKGKITLGEFEQALREQQDRLRPTLGGRDPAVLNSPELRHAVLDNIALLDAVRLFGRQPVTLHVDLEPDSC